ncbi:MAG: ankyrin repeat domain-containing protein [Gammaproteobacteria bacterium]|nr:MAG: ankyrin repeat domain-containing protein [Gammaproteobacteria bacterium]
MMVRNNELTEQLKQLISRQGFLPYKAMQLVREGADATVMSEDGQTLLHSIVKYGRQLPDFFNVIKELAENYVNVDILNEHGKTPLEVLINTPFYSHNRVILLMLLGANSRVKNKEGYTALSLLLYSARLINDQYFVGAVVDVTTLMAIFCDNRAMVERLCRQHPKTINDKHPLGIIPAQLARDEGHLHLALLLEYPEEIKYYQNYSDDGIKQVVRQVNIHRPSDFKAFSMPTHPAAGKLMLRVALFSGEKYDNPEGIMRLINAGCQRVFSFDHEKYSEISPERLLCLLLASDTIPFGYEAELLSHKHLIAETLEKVAKNDPYGVGLQLLKEAVNVENALGWLIHESRGLRASTTYQRIQNEIKVREEAKKSALLSDQLLIAVQTSDWSKAADCIQAGASKEQAYEWAEQQEEPRKFDCMDFLFEMGKNGSLAALVDAQRKREGFLGRSSTKRNEEKPEPSTSYQFEL